MTLAQVARHDPRPIAVVMADALDTADRVHVDARSRTMIGEDAANEIRLLESAERVMKLAKTMIDAGVAVKLVEQRERDMEAEAKVIVSAIAAVVDPLLAALPIALGDGALRQEWRTWAYKTALAGMFPGNVESPPPVPGRIASGTAQVVDAETVNAEITYSR